MNAKRAVPILAAILAFALYAALWLRRLRREPFSFGGIFKKVASGVGTAVGTVARVVPAAAVTAAGATRTAVSAGVNAGGSALINHATSGGGDPMKRPGTSGSSGPTYKARYWDGVNWVCSSGVESGMPGDKGCITSQYHPRTAKPGTADFKCPLGTIPSGYDDVNGRCEVGWTYRVWTDGDKWVCPADTWDSGKTWSDGIDGHRQCKRYGPYTQRVLQGGKWVCPPGTRDTGLSWNNKHQGHMQCLWLGGPAP